jgi:hypothetical protein
MQAKDSSSLSSLLFRSGRLFLDRQVIFVGSTSYSGSTFLDMTLGNDPHGFSCGEVFALFHPTRPHHVNPPCGCGDPACNIWDRIRRNGPDHLYETIFNLFPQVRFIVDSSKDPFWIQSQVGNLQRQGNGSKHLLVWKTPLEIAHSFKKRGLANAWEKSWVNYHRLYNALIWPWRSIQYRRYVTEPALLEEICRYLNIPYFPGKERYWEKRHHLLFGNSSARIHLHTPDELKQNHASIQYTDEERAVAQAHYRHVYYQEVMDEELKRKVEQRIASSPVIQSLLALLSARDVTHAGGDDNRPKSQECTSSFNVQLYRLRQKARYAIGRFRYER